MAVQAQYPTNAFSPDFRNRALDDVQMMQDPRDLLQLHGGGIGGLGKQEHQILNTGVGFSGRQSELTCNASGSRKRAREDSMALPSLHNPALSPLIPIPGVLLQSRSLESGATSTSGRHVPSSQAVSPPVRDLVSLLLQQNLEIDALVRVQSERLRNGLEEARKRHCRALLAMLEQQAAKRLMEKEAELETASRRNAELEEKVRQLSEENQMWFTMAKNNEEIACGLRTSLAQALLQGAPAAAGHERFGDGDGGGAAFPADDAQSCCFEVEERRKACKACGERDVCVLMLPCRHVCVCKECESKADTCPVCGSTKNAYLQVFMC